MIYIVIICIIWILIGLLGFIREIRVHYINPDGIDIILNLLCILGGPIYYYWVIRTDFERDD